MKHLKKILAMLLSLCLLLCIDSVKEETLHRQMVMLNIDTKDPATEIWKEICVLYAPDIAFGKLSVT